MSRYRRLRHEDRCQIYALLKAGITQQRIAGHLGVSQGTISRELSRNSSGRGYRIDRAEAKALARQSARSLPRKLTAQLRRRIMRLLRQKRWSPEQIAEYLTPQGTPISHETIYGFIRRDRQAGGELCLCLRRRGKRYNRRADKTAGRGIIPDRTDISCRPKLVERRQRIGDWEGDTMLGPRRRGALLTLVERKSRFTKLALLPGPTAEAAQQSIVQKLRRIRKRVHTLTFDNGKEFAQHKAIAKALKAQIYFAKPYHAWERGVNENTNGLIRDFFPKGTDFSTVTHKEVAAVERLLNARPRKILGFKSPTEVFHRNARR